MRILVTGQCSLHWGRLENGNIGNYYITEVAFRELHRVFPDAEIVTTFQMTEDFCLREKVTCLPLDLFFNWDEQDIRKALKDYTIAESWSRTKVFTDTTPYISEVMKCDLVIDFSGELWGDHAEPVGKNRFLVGLLKIRTAQLLNKKTVLLAGSQGPFSDKSLVGLAHEVFENFSSVLNRESTSEGVLRDAGFNVTKVKNYTDAAFLFDPLDKNDAQKLMSESNLFVADSHTVGFILCGFNMLEGPYDKQPRQDEEFVQFAECVEYMVDQLKVRVVLMSHQNGFKKDPEFKLIQGRDFPFALQLYDVIRKRNKIDLSKVVCPDRPYTPKETKSIIGNLDMLVTGRIHGFVAGVSQCIPTVIINRGFGPVSHRNIGFADSVGMVNFIADPSSSADMIAKVSECWNNRKDIHNKLNKIIPEVKERAHECFNALHDLF